MGLIRSENSGGAFQEFSCVSAALEMPGRSIEASRKIQDVHRVNMRMKVSFICREVLCVVLMIQGVCLNKLYHAEMCGGRKTFLCGYAFFDLS